VTGRPRTNYPIEEIEAQLITALADRGSAVVVSPPGSGKTTVVPLMLLGQPWRTGKIVMLEPRRIATRAAARRIAQLLGEDVGGRVGYVTRDDRRTGPGVQIEVVTEGVLTRRLQSDPGLSGTSCVIFDEVHERNLQTDLGLALLLDARAALRPDLRVLAMSATIDSSRVATILGGERPAPVVEGDGRLHPVEIVWRPPGPRERHLEPHMATSISRIMDDEPGDVLAFLPGMAEINRVAEQLERHGVYAAVHRLHGGLPIEDQDAALRSGVGQRKVVLATDIAESSLTVEGVRIVVDGGKARAPRFDPRTGMTRLRTVSISKASADQRSGRAGRLEPGVAVRLWSKMEHAGRGRDIEPEIKTVDLAGLVLELTAWGARDPAQLPFLDPPPRRAWHEGVALLTALGALDADALLTDLGRAMGALPLHPRLARMVVSAGADAGLASLIAALVDDRDILRMHPDERPVDLNDRLRILLGEDDGRADRRAVARVRRNASDIVRRAGASDRIDGIEPSGRLLALAFPDRLGYQRGGPGRFQLRTGTTAWMNQTDPLAIEPFVVVADLDGRRKDARIRLAAAIDAADVASSFDNEVETSSDLIWHGRRLVTRTTRRLGGMTLDIADRRPEPSEAVSNIVLRRLEKDGLAMLTWSEDAAQLRHRVRHLRRRLGPTWPEWSDETLVAQAAEWLGPFVAAVGGLDDVEALDVGSLLRRWLGHPYAFEIDQLAPIRVEVPSGRLVRVDYSGEEPRISVAVQEMFGAVASPMVGGQPVVVELLSPARRPVQITKDIAGFWAGSWEEVRKEMAGRYPKHEWPADPLSASPVRK